MVGTHTIRTKQDDIPSIDLVYTGPYFDNKEFRKFLVDVTFEAHLKIRKRVRELNERK